MSRSGVKLPPEVTVEWEDAYSRDGWQRTTDDPGPQLVRSRGYLIFSNRERVGLAQSVGVDGESIADLLVVPRGMVRKLTRH